MPAHCRHQSLGSRGPNDAHPLLLRTPPPTGAQPGSGSGVSPSVGLSLRFPMVAMAFQSDRHPVVDRSLLPQLPADWIASPSTKHATGCTSCPS